MSRLAPLHQVQAALVAQEMTNVLEIADAQRDERGEAMIRFVRKDDRREAEVPFTTAMELLPRHDDTNVDALWEELASLGFTRD